MFHQTNKNKDRQPNRKDKNMRSFYLKISRMVNNAMKMLNLVDN